MTERELCFYLLGRLRNVKQELNSDNLKKDIRKALEETEETEFTNQVLALSETKAFSAIKSLVIVKLTPEPIQRPKLTLLEPATILINEKTSGFRKFFEDTFRSE